LNLENIKIEDTKYVSNRFEIGFSDIVVKTSVKTKKDKKKPVDIYFIIEHITEGRMEIFIQVLKYMVFEWEKDYNNSNPPRVIIPMGFYHGAEQWKMLDESKIDRGEFMPTLAQQMKEEFMETMVQQLKAEGKKEEKQIA
jgi:hypothetical protein